jgi:hypothetical protein
VQRCPEVNHVAAGTAAQVETVETVLAQIDAQAAIARLRGVQRARATALGPATFQGVELPVVTQHALQRQLASQVRKVDPRTATPWARKEKGSGGRVSFLVS